MVKQILTETFEQLTKLPLDIAQGAVKSVVGGQGKQVDPLTGIEIPTQRKIKQLKKREYRQKAAAIPHARQIIYGLPKKPAPSIDQLPAFEEKQKLPPPVSASKPKWGTGERKGGISG